MKLAIILIILTAVYAMGITFLIRELKTHPSAEERRDNQSIPMILAATCLYVTLVVKLVQFSIQGVLPLL